MANHLNGIEKWQRTGIICPNMICSIPNLIEKRNINEETYISVTNSSTFGPCQGKRLNCNIYNPTD